MVLSHKRGEKRGALVNPSVSGITIVPSAFVMIVGCSCTSEAVLPSGGGGAGAGARTFGSCLDIRLAGVAAVVCGGITTRGSQSRAINRLALSDLSEILHLNDARRNRNHHTLLRRRDMWPLDVLDLVRLRLQAAPQAAVS